MVRVVRKRDTQDDQILPQAFQPRPTDTYISVHWLEYFGPLRGFDDAMQALRDFLGRSAHGELKLDSKGRLVALRVNDICAKISDRRWTRLWVRHVPRASQVYRTGLGHEVSGKRFDPHSGIYSVPRRHAEELAVQQFLLGKIVHDAPAKLPKQLEAAADQKKVSAPRA